MKSEERRALVLLGITAVLASLLATMYALIWTGAKKQEDFFFNVPCTAVPHLTVYDVALLEPLIRAWVVYAVFAFFYFSEDWFQGRRGTRFRTFCHVFAAFSMGFYFLYVVWFIPALYVLLVWIPAELADLYVVAVLIGLFYTEIRFVEMATGTRGAFKEQLIRFWNRTGKPVSVAARPRLMTLIGKLWNKYRGIFPYQLHHRLVWLRLSIRIIRRKRRLRGKIIFKLFTVSLGIVAISLVVGYSLYRFYCG